jgi:hypothetical protein
LQFIQTYGRVLVYYLVDIIMNIFQKKALVSVFVFGSLFGSLLSPLAFVSAFGVGNITVTPDPTDPTDASTTGFTVTSDPVITQDGGFSTTSDPVVTVDTGSVYGQIFNDANDNGVKDDSETVMTNVAVILSNTTDTSAPQVMTTTNDVGTFGFTDLTAGSYTVCEVLPTATPAWNQTNSADGFDCGNGVKGYEVTVSADIQWNKNFLNYQAPAVVLDTTAPTTVITSPNPDSSFTDAILLSGMTTDVGGVASTTLAYAPYDTDAQTCGAYTDIITLDNISLSNEFDWTYNWAVPANGVYCITAHGRDVAGNVEHSPVVENITYTQPVAPVTPPAPSSDTSGSGSSAGNGGGSTTGGGNGPIVGSLSSGSNNGNGSNIVVEGNQGNISNPSTGGTTPTPTPKILALNTPSQGDTSVDTGTANTGTTDVSTSTVTLDSNTAGNQTASVVFGYEWNNWYWLIILVLLTIVGGVFYTQKKK